MENKDPEGYYLEEISGDVLEEVIPLAIQFYRYQEPLLDYIGVSMEETEELMKPLVTKWIQNEIGIAARSKDTGAIVGLLFGQTLKEGDLLVWGSIKSDNEKIKYYAKICGLLEESVNVLEMFNSSVALDHAMLAVEKNHRGKGIGLMMAKKMEEIGISKGIRVFAVSAVNVATHKIYRKLGYQVVFEYEYNQLELHGKKLFDLSLSNGTTSGTVLVKRV